VEVGAAGATSAAAQTHALAGATAERPRHAVSLPATDASKNASNVVCIASFAGAPVLEGLYSNMTAPSVSMVQCMRLVS
jgi:hypothetical protein